MSDSNHIEVVWYSNFRIRVNIDGRVPKTESLLASFWDYWGSSRILVLSKSLPRNNLAYLCLRASQEMRWDTRLHSSRNSSRGIFDDHNLSVAYNFHQISGKPEWLISHFKFGTDIPRHFQWSLDRISTRIQIPIHATAYSPRCSQASHQVRIHAVHIRSSSPTEKIAHFPHLERGLWWKKSEISADRYCGL